MRRLLRRCYLCESSFRGDGNICPRCVALFPALPALCARCAEPLPVSVGADCPACMQQSLDFTRVVVAWAWGRPLSGLIKRFKFNGDRLLGQDLAHLLAKHVGGELSGLLPQPDCVVPMPLHPSRLRERGFNQAQLLAKAVSDQAGWPLLLAAKRVRATPAQSGLKRAERQRNLRGAFAVVDSVKGRNVLIVDDVMTTGSSVQALSRELVKAGAASVQVVVICKVL